jgi:hypothetical protein
VRAGSCTVATERREVVLRVCRPQVLDPCLGLRVLPRRELELDVAPLRARIRADAT